MSHSVTVTRTTTTSTSSAILINTGYFKTIPGLLKFLETVLGAICIGLIFSYSTTGRLMYDTEYIYFMLISVTFFIATAINLISCILSFTTATILPKTMFELLYHGFAFLLYVAAAIALLVKVDKYKGSTYYEEQMAAAAIGLVNSGLYLISTFYSHRSYRGA